MSSAPSAGGAARRTPARPRSGARPPAGPSPARLSEIFSLIGEELSLVEKEFDSHLGSDVEIIETVGRYIAEGGGKRIRPALFLLCARLCGYRGDRHILFASVFELIHTATLVHDDIIDGATMRRGRSSVNSRWGSHLTVLLGDYLYLKSMTLALSADELRLIKVLCDITLTMIEGELMQAERNGSLDVSEADHMEIVRRKTAMLFAGCGRVAAELAGVDPARAAALESYALNLGMAFQLVDDLLDFTATESVLGKPVASDLKEGRLTLPLIHLLEKGVEEHRRLVGLVLREGGFVSVAREEILSLLRRHGTLDRTRRMAEAYSEAAVGALDRFEDSPSRRALVDVARFITSRDH
ncbi:MAG TPA: polyprenyl synthetase family protein [Candidatus Polarisedimenticolia bacterium]|nr:polyprenyl synthetase family protein [Candidatus Polarisedimenticolia bacterium]